ncbi:glycoside hydrolase family 43 protein [Glycomyces arizonensis]|uniref:glycoside hydrolase family 43 protein n=1 Tax=Glycomyces arizonensis TaxID=256035 RepID=UPI0004064067|nr:glycoside hydrolase family 43 protein [Glycomyces arizonensis]
MRSDHPGSFPLRLPEMPLHDPYIVADAESGLYHLYTANQGFTAGATGPVAPGGVGTMVYRSENLRDWAEPVPVFLVEDQDGPWAGHGAWAPEVHRWNGAWYLFTTLHDENAVLEVPPPDQYGLPVRLRNHRRSTVTAVSDSLTGPFRMIKPEGPILPAELMTLDGTLFVDDDGGPWMVYANEWLQRVDGTIEAFPLTDGLDAVAGEAVMLFKGSDAAWITRELPAGVPHQLAPYVTDGPQLYRTPAGALVCLWSTYEKNRVTGGRIDGDYVQTYAVAASGRLEGPWVQGEPLVRGDSGHGMLFTDFEGRLMMVLHRPFTGARGKLYEMELSDADLRVVRQRTDLDGDA